MDVVPHQAKCVYLDIESIVEFSDECEEGVAIRIVAEDAPPAGPSLHDVVPGSGMVETT